jgi:hypothetical protein
MSEYLTFSKIRKSKNQSKFGIFYNFLTYKALKQRHGATLTYIYNAYFILLMRTQKKQKQLIKNSLFTAINQFTFYCFFVEIYCVQYHVDLSFLDNSTEIVVIPALITCITSAEPRRISFSVYLP